jgi:hypothetical protein
MHLQKEFDDKGNKVDFTINFVNKFYDLPIPGFSVKRAMRLSEVERVSLPSFFATSMKFCSHSVWYAFDRYALARTQRGSGHITTHPEGLT